MHISDYGYTAPSDYSPCLPARVVGEHRGRYQIVCDAGAGFATLRGGAYYYGGETFPTVGDFVLLAWQQAGDSAIRRLAGKVKRLDRLVRVDDADRRGRPPIEWGESPQGQWIIERAQALAIKDSAPKPVLLGRHLIARGLTPGLAFKKILNAAFEAQLDGEFTELTSAQQWLDNYLKNHPAD